MPSEKRKIGDIGEAVAVRFLIARGFEILDKNYLKKWGEIDIVARNGNNLHFVEVKTTQSKVRSEKSKADVSGENIGSRETYNPAENVHPKKLERMHRAIQSYLRENRVSQETEWQIDVVTVALDLDTKKAEVDLIENVV